MACRKVTKVGNVPQDKIDRGNLLSDIRTLTEQIVGDISGARRGAEGLDTNQLRRLVKEMTWFKDDLVHWRMGMARKTYSLDLKIDFEDQTRHAMMEKLLRRLAKQVLTQATLLADGRQPQVALRSEDFFMGNDEIQVVREDEENEDSLPGVG